MTSKRRSLQESLKASLCRGRLQETSDGLWYTNGHWLARKHLCKVIRSTPALSDHQPDPSALQLPPAEVYRETTIDTDFTMDGFYSVVTEDEIVSWIDPRYAEAWDRGLAYVAGPFDPILFGGRTVDEAYAIVMPADLRKMKTKAKLLRRWLAKVK